MDSKRFSWKARFKSFVYAYEGLIWFFTHEHNAWIHGFATVFVLLISFIFKISGLDLIAILFAIALVLIAEMFNTAIEKIMDHLSPAQHPSVKVIKDIAAAAVLIAAIIAAIVGLIIFTPKIL
jgi:diacylglycerol kinase (ATP)